MDRQLIYNKVKTMLPQKRFIHSVGVAECAIKLSKIYNYDKDKSYIAGITHDCAKYLSKDEVDYYVSKYKIELDELESNSLALSHSLIGSYIARYELDIKDEDIINAIKYHTTGKKDMTLLEKIIYMADLIEENRDYPGVELLRELTYSGKLDEALLLSFNNTIKLILDRNQLIHPRTVEARNYILKNKIS